MSKLLAVLGIALVGIKDSEGMVIDPGFSVSVHMAHKSLANDGKDGQSTLT
jgi:hypothetical protein